MKNNPHIEFERLADFVEGCLATDDRASVNNHISQCSRCAEKAAQLESVIGLMNEDRSEDAPRYAIANAVAMFCLRKKPAESGVRRLLATLKFDSLTMSPAFGVRAGAATDRQLLYLAGQNRLHMQVSAVGEKWQISGQVLGPCAGGTVELRGPAGTIETSLDEICEFMFPPVASGSYALMLHLSDTDMEVPELKMGTEAD
ncbi:MAG TPA: hypothetical protein VNN73_08445 [Blastocatellia bacterium]|nr:hypothetical protein [Blastocatellia bacterium]